MMIARGPFLSLVLSVSASAQDFPTGPIAIVKPFGRGRRRLVVTERNKDLLMQTAGTTLDGQKVTDAKTFWSAIGVRAVGAAVVTAQGIDGPTGFLALSVAHLASNPPTMMVGIGKKTSAIAVVEN